MQDRSPQRQPGPRPSASVRCLPARALLAGIAFVVAAAEASAAEPIAAGDAQKRVLAIYSSRRDAPYTLLVETAMRSALKAGLGGELDYYAEHVDFGRFSTPAYEAALRAFLRGKYGTLPLDVVITEGKAPLDFVAQHREELFPGTPLVFSAEEGDLPRVGNATGVVFPVDLEATLGVALQLQPDVRRVFVVSGSSEFDRFYAQIARAQFRTHERRVAFTYLPSLPLEQLLEAVERLPPGSIVYFVSMFEDAAGSRLIPVDVLDRLTARANAPVYCWPEMALDHGIVGGSLLSEEAVARETAALALRVLRGQRPESIAIVRSRPYVLAFDARQLRRWRIDEGRLPPASVVRFGEESLLRRYRGYVAAGLALVAAQLALIAGLLVERSSRRRAEREAHESRERLSRLTRVSAMGELAASLAHELNQPLAGILANAQAAVRLAASDPHAPPELKEALVDIIDDDKRAAEVIRRMRDLASGRASERSRVDVNGLAHQAVRLVRSDAIIRKVSLRFDPAPAAQMVRADPVQLQQVILNLLANALDAAQHAPRPPGKAVVALEASDGPMVHLVVRDNGPGLASGAEGRVFEAFFTTKPSGMGMGLAIARTIIEAHGGRIWASDAAGAGAEFHLALPRLHEEPGDPAGSRS